ncbi:diacylglycerol kinase delta-like isoform X2 [Tubulanus polymorphus]|uniref:diacylglycerol kinase delta-like isoform X2 n=1 Tax=Tubulanus polymorphus TaxID=672921 RepID=UPI003DA1D733
MSSNDPKLVSKWGRASGGGGGVIIDGEHVDKITHSQDDSSESDGETEPAKSFHRRISTNKDLKTARCMKEGYLAKQTNSFQRWRRRYFKLKPRKLYYAKDTMSVIFDEIALHNLSIAECSTKNVNHSFQVITPFRNLVLCAESRKEMEDWISALKSAANNEFYDPTVEHRDMMSGQHNWYACSHARPTYCNVCRDTLSGVTSHGLSCEVCKFKAHKKCAVRAQNNCKWTTLAAVGNAIMEDEDGNLASPHQWLEGNLPVSAKCIVCDKTCGSVLRLQDLRCLWCKAMVHSGCVDTFPKKCSLGPCHMSVLPFIAINNIDSDGYWEATRPPGTCPLLVYVNSKSGDNQGVKFLRRFKQLLNPAQVFDLMNGGPYTGLRLFQKFDPFHILVCGGDGSVGWVLREIDKLNLQSQCQVGVLPLGTGNDLARVLGWGSTFDDDTQLVSFIEKLEHAQIKMLDRWSVLTYEGTMPPPRKISQQFDPISVYEDSVANHLSKILHSDDHSVVISSAKVLCETVKDFVAKVGEAYEGDIEDNEVVETEDNQDDSISKKCCTLNEKLDALLTTLNTESQASAQKVTAETQSIPEVDEEKDQDREKELTSQNGSTATLVGETSHEMMHQDSISSTQSDIDRQSFSGSVDTTASDKDTTADNKNCPRRRKRVKPQIFKPKDQLMCRANSLKKAIRQIIEHTEKAVDEQNAQTVEHELVCAFTEQSESPVDIPTHSSFFTHSASSSSSSSRHHHCNPQHHHSGNFLEVPTYSVMSSSGAASRTPSPRLSPRLKRLGISSGVAGSLVGGSFISKVLLANADALCAAASPLMEEEIALDDFTERCVMNNYFGIGLDAKISLDFHLKREEHPERCSRTKNLMWYGVLGGKELLQKTFKNLDQRVQLECDGQRIPLPSLQGIVVLNIPSYMGGANFWGGTKEDYNFTAPSFDDKILEVVAVFGSMQMAVSKVINLQHHRIAQCRSVKITIMGDEGVPVQVDGEAWIQPPGYMRIIHKNRSQMLTRDRSFETTLKSWSEKQKERPVSPVSIPTYISEDEIVVLLEFVEAAANLIKSVKVASISHSSVEQELFQLSTQASSSLDKLYPAGKLSEVVPRSHVTDLINAIKALHHEASVFLSEKASAVRLREDLEEKMSAALANVEVELKRVNEIPGLQPSDYEFIYNSDPTKRKHGGHHGRFRIMTKLIKGKHKDNRERDKHASQAQSFNVNEWNAEDVGQWLDFLSMSEYKEMFIRNDIRGPELLSLERRDLKDMGISKVGHLKRLQQAIKELNKQVQTSE